jgi:hypothetical protein
MTTTERPTTDRTADRSKDHAEQGNRRVGNGQRDALAALVDQWFDAWTQAVETQRAWFQSSLDLMGPVYSVLEEATAVAQSATSSTLPRVTRRD